MPRSFFKKESGTGGVW